MIALTRPSFIIRYRVRCVATASTAASRLFNIRFNNGIAISSGEIAEQEERTASDQCLPASSTAIATAASCTASNSTVHRGRDFEMRCIRKLKRFSFQLDHCGGSGDKGVDFMGSWHLPNSQPLVIGQCKLIQSIVRPRSSAGSTVTPQRRKLPLSALREWMAVQSMHNRRTRTVTMPTAVVGILMSTAELTTGGVQLFDSSPHPMIFSQMLPSFSRSLHHTIALDDADRQDQLISFYLNRACQQLMPEISVSLSSSGDVMARINT